jgi:hypothetical protein
MLRINVGADRMREERVQHLAMAVVHAGDPWLVARRVSAAPRRGSLMRIKSRGAT